jgi:hypothetical protein
MHDKPVKLLRDPDLAAQSGVGTDSAREFNQVALHVSRRPDLRGPFLIYQNVARRTDAGAAAPTKRSDIILRASVPYFLLRAFIISLYVYHWDADLS